MKMAPIICQNISHGERGSFQTADVKDMKHGILAA